MKYVHQNITLWEDLLDFVGQATTHTEHSDVLSYDVKLSELF